MLRFDGDPAASVTAQSPAKAKTQLAASLGDQVSSPQGTSFVPNRHQVGSDAGEMRLMSKAIP
eukprot:6784762-Pyramimonas_sp.AAC.1